MLHLTMRNILSHKRRVISSLFSIVLGVAFLAGTFVFTDSLQRTFDDLFGSVYAKTDVVVRSTQEIETDFGFQVRGRISDELLAAVAAVPGVSSVNGSVSGYARILDAEGNPLGVDQGSPNFGMDIIDSEFSVWTLREGRVPKGSQEMAMDAGSFRLGHFTLGDQVKVMGQRGIREFALVGVVSFGSTDSPAGSRVALFELATAQDFVGQPGQLDGLNIRGDGSLGQQALADRIGATLPSGMEAITGKAIAAESSNQVKKAMGFFNTLLMVFAFVALFVGSFIIYNTFSILVAQRRRENAMLRAIGGSVRQVQASLLIEALVMGTLGSVIGFGAGFGMAVFLRRMMTALNIDLPESGLVLLPRTIVVSLVVGVVITLAAALLPALRGGRVPPIAALRDVAVEQPSFSPRRLMSGLAILAVSVVLIIIGLTGEIAVLGVGVGLLFIGMFVLGPLIARPVAGLLGAPAARLRGLAGALARQNAMRNPKRTARTAAALMVGVALVAAITVFAASVKGSIRAIIGEQFTGDLVVSTKTFGFGGLPTTLAYELGDVPGVAAATGIQLGQARIDGADKAVTVVDPATVGELFDMQFVSGAVTALDDQGLLVSRDQAGTSHLAMGDTVKIEFLNGTSRTLKVEGIYAKDEMAGAFTISKSLYATSGGDQFDFSVFLIADRGASMSAVESAVRSVVDAYPMSKLETRHGYIESQAAQIDTFVNLVYGLLALAVVVAVFGIANTLSLSVYERTRELGLLRAVGATRAQVRSMVRWESVVTALLGAVQGVVVGTLLGWAVVLALRDQGFGEFIVPYFTLAVVLIVAVVCGVVAATRPASRASRLDVLASIHSE
ncbi:MAG: FtsX-like permease family protein [Ilumatobacteraceae bacterium]